MDTAQTSIPPRIVAAMVFGLIFLVAVSSLFVAAARYQKLSLHEKRGMTRLQILRYTLCGGQDHHDLEEGLFASSTSYSRRVRVPPISRASTFDQRLPKYDVGIPPPAYCPPGRRSETDMSEVEAGGRGRPLAMAPYQRLGEDY
ncbi:hypothetical protein PLICRDRAFT_52728 [Plicaturopsis crispa FD-325 SS-3]|nr:hypothetical protein PLICRDRAFT_52728 [Plicaturopsis crispa FD-325 SS-3]